MLEQRQNNFRYINNIGNIPFKVDIIEKENIKLATFFELSKDTKFSIRTLTSLSVLTIAIFLFDLEIASFILKTDKNIGFKFFSLIILFAYSIITFLYYLRDYKNLKLSKKAISKKLNAEEIELQILKDKTDELRTTLEQYEKNSNANIHIKEQILRKETKYISGYLGQNNIQTFFNRQYEEHIKTMPLNISKLEKTKSKIELYKFILQYDNIINVKLNGYFTFILSSLAIFSIIFGPINFKFILQ